MIKKILIPVILLFFFFSCKKGEAYLNNSFPGFSGSGDKATWVVYNHNFTDKPFIQSKLSSQTSFKTLGSFDTSYRNARQREVTPYSYQFGKNGEVYFISTNPISGSTWVLQQNMKAEVVQGQLFVSKQINGQWVNTFVGFQDQDKILFKYKKSYFGDVSSDKDRFFMEVLYSMFK
ncbi:MAG: hypothetical protein ACK5GP_10310 [bacterium]|jgi:hypothetical protein